MSKKLARVSVIANLSIPRLLGFWIGSAVFVILYTCLYIGGLWDPNSRLNALQVAFLNLDEGFNGPYPEPVRQGFLNITGGKTLGEMIKSSILGPGAPTKDLFGWDDLAGKDVDKAATLSKLDAGDYWGVVVIPPTFSNDFASNFNFSAASAPPGTIITSSTRRNMSLELHYDQGRQFSTASFVVQGMKTVVGTLSRSFALQILAGSSPQTLSALDRQFFINPIDLELHNIHPVLKFGQHMATYMLFVIMWLGSLIGVTVIHRNMISRLGKLGLTRDPTTNKLTTRFSSIAIGHATAGICILFAFLHALFAWTFFYIIGGNDTFNQGATTGHDLAPGLLLVFLWYLGIVAFSINSFLAVIFGVDTFAVFSSLLLIMNLVGSNAVFDTMLMPEAFKVMDSILPMTYAVRGLRALLFGSLKDTQTANCLALLGWFLVTFVLASVIGAWRICRFQKQEIERDNAAAETEGRGATGSVGTLKRVATDKSSKSVGGSNDWASKGVEPNTSAAVADAEASGSKKSLDTVIA
ncbi:hypothetical protein HK102_000199 [Quaeritorhiza haematococci]|nr:hypothetical protein HK102_000199 [Quaeritorhiza haematococci]